MLLYTHLTHRTFLSFPVGMAGKVCYNRQDTGESDFCFVSGTKKETFFDTREEEKCGNTEFRSAKEAIRQQLERLDCPELGWFTEHLLPTFSLTIDEMQM